MKPPITEAWNLQTFAFAYNLAPSPIARGVLNAEGMNIC